MNNMGIFMESMGIIVGVTRSRDTLKSADRATTHGVWIGEARRFLSLKDSH